MSHIPIKSLLITPSGQKFVPGALPGNTRRSLLAFGGCGFFGLSTDADWVQRLGFTLGQTPTRCRLRIRNHQIIGTPGVSTAPVTLQSVYWGTPAISGKTVWDGVMATTNSVLGAQAAVDMGTTEFVTPWFTPPATALANVPQAISIAFTCASGSNIYTDAVIQGLKWAATSGTAQSAQNGNLAAPTGGAAGKGSQDLDIRMEFEYVGNNPQGLFIGDSMTNSSLNSGGLAFNLCGMNEQWPHMAALRMGHCDMNGALSGAKTTDWDGATTTAAWARILAAADDITAGYTWPGNVPPDYAVILLGTNDSGGTNLFSLATFQANIGTIISNLISLGVNKIFVCTIPPGGTTDKQSGQLLTTVTGAQTTVTVVGGTNATPGAQVGAGGSYPGLLASWASQAAYLGACTQSNNGISADGQEVTVSNVTTAFTSGNTVLTFSSTTFGQNHHAGSAVMTQAEGLRQLYNQWIMQGVPGTIATFDVNGWTMNPAPVLQIRGLTNATTGVAWGGGIPGIEQVNPRWYNSGAVGPHPNDPGFYRAIADHIVPQLIGV